MLGLPPHPARESLSPIIRRTHRVLSSFRVLAPPRNRMGDANAPQEAARPTLVHLARRCFASLSSGFNVVAVISIDNVPLSTTLFKPGPGLNRH